jgi:protein-L-isoaspartate(D-aspartate) O-methyltransferase
MHRALLLLPAVGAMFSAIAAAAEDPRQPLREAMVENQIIARGVSDPATIQAMRTVERHRFVSPDMARRAYDDNPLPIGYGQTISQPYIVAYMTEAIRPAKGQKVLEIGTGSGYQAAILAEIVDQVYTIEIVEPLALEAQKRLTELGYSNIHVRHGDGYHGWPEEAPFDAIVVTAGAETIPPMLVEQLRDGGRMIIPVGPQEHVQHLLLIEKKDGKLTQHKLFPVRFVPFTRSELNTP